MLMGNRYNERERNFGGVQVSVYYLCSGFGMEHSFNNKFGELLAKDLEKRNSLVVIPCAENMDDVEAHVSFFTEQLAETGIFFENIVILSKEMTQVMQCAYIENADLIYFMGGYPFIQRDFIEENKLRNSLQEYSGVVLGISAGAMNMSKYIIMVTDGEHSNETRVEKGLGLVDFSVYPHCAFSGDIFAKSFYIGSDLVDSEKLLIASRNIGDVYFLQNKTETDMLKISFIREEDGKKEFVSMYDGKVWKATTAGYKLIEEYV